MTDLKLFHDSLLEVQFLLRRGDILLQSVISWLYLDSNAYEGRAAFAYHCLFAIRVC